MLILLAGGSGTQVISAQRAGVQGIFISSLALEKPSIWRITDVAAEKHSVGSRLSKQRNQKEEAWKEW